MRRFTNWIAGACSASKAGLFPLGSSSDGAPIGEWPHSGALEVEAALGSLEPSVATTSDGPLATLEDIDRAWGEVLRLTRDSPCAIPQDLPGGAQPAQAFRSGIDLLSERLHGLADGGANFLTPGSYSAFGFGAMDLGACGIVAVFCHWSDSLEAVFEAIAECLIRGRCALVFTDPNLPMVGAVAIQALLGAQVGGNSIALLHGLDNEGWSSVADALVEGRISCIGRIDEGTRTELAPYAKHEPHLHELMARLMTPLEAEWKCPAALLSAHRTLDQGAIQSAARDLANGAFGVSKGYGGLRHGAPLVARIPRAIYSAFVAALTTELDKLIAAPGAPQGFEGAGKWRLSKTYQAQWQAGLDEGATLVTGGSGELRPGGQVFLHPALLVNLGCESPLFDLGEPLGVLRLYRA